MGLRNIFKMAKQKIKDPNDKSRFCVDCGDQLLDYNGDLLNGMACYGERINRVWIYRCKRCNKANFCGMINSHPLLKAKYHGIYNKSPEEQLK